MTTWSGIDEAPRLPPALFQQGHPTIPSGGKRCPILVQFGSEKDPVLSPFLAAVQVALLTIYDMCKAVDRGMTINGVRVLEKHGGKSGSFVNP